MLCLRGDLEIFLGFFVILIGLGVQKIGAIDGLPVPDYPAFAEKFNDP